MLKSDVHFLESAEDKRQRLRDRAQHIPGALCGHGAYYQNIETTTIKKYVTCQECIEKLNEKRG